MSGTQGPDTRRSAKGQSYSPYKLFYAAQLPLGIAAHPSISWLAKVLFAILARHAGKDNHTFVRLKELARELQTSIDTIKRGLHELIEAGLIRRKRGGDGRPATCTFVWCKSLETSLRKSVSDSVELPNPNRSDCADLHHHYKEEESHQESHIRESSSSSGRSIETAAEEEEDSTSLTKPQTRSHEDIRRFAEFMYTNLRGTDAFGDTGPELPKPPDSLVIAILNLASDWMVPQVEAGVLMQATVHGTRKIRSYNWFKIAVQGAIKTCNGTPPEPIQPTPEPTLRTESVSAMPPDGPYRYESAAPTPLSPQQEAELKRRSEQDNRFQTVYNRQTHSAVKRPPKHLSPEMKSFWRGIAGEYELTPDAAMILRTACENWDRAQQAREAIARDGLVGADGRRHAGVDVEKQGYSLFLRSMRQLGLDVIPPGSLKPGRPGR